jgi:hypothetical protein
MSTQQLLIPRGATVQRSGRRIAIITSIAVALFAGALIGRVTAPDASSLVAHPATLVTIGHLSQADAGRAEMFRAMNGLLSTAIIQPATTLDPSDVSPASSARLNEMFRAMNGLRHQQI